MAGQEYISLDAVANKLGVKKATVYYYIKRLNIKTQKFELDRHTYMQTQDFERVKQLKESARERSADTAA